MKVIRMLGQPRRYKYYTNTPQYYVKFRLYIMLEINISAFFPPSDQNCVHISRISSPVWSRNNIWLRETIIASLSTQSLQFIYPSFLLAQNILLGIPFSYSQQAACSAVGGVRPSTAPKQMSGM